MKTLIGFVLGVVFVLALGMAYTHTVWIGGWLSTPPYYESALSGVGPNGECYFALTSTITGRTEIAKICISEPNQANIYGHFSDKAFERGRGGRLIYTPDKIKEVEQYLQDMQELRP